ncbi:MAG: single-stranded DNA-binding protein [Bdellovibrionales bacterium]|nr:single-stranded DNA-binding protein [Bdellovibrionales bacterium]
MSINKVILIGNLGQNPEVKHSASGQAICNLSIATNESWTDKNGQKQEKTEWHRVVVFGKLAEICGQYLQKGRQAYIEGKLQTRSWQDKDNQTRYTTEVVAQSVQFLGGNAGAGRSSNQEYGNSNSNYGAQNQNYGGSSNYGSNSGGNSNYGAGASFQSEPTFTEEDVPF